MTDALFRTGPGPFTDEILNFALAREHQRGQSVRILPRVTLGGLPGGAHGISLWEEPTRLVAHLHMGSWKGYGFKRKARLMGMGETKAKALLLAPPDSELERRLYPVSIVTQPPFTIMTHLKGHNKVSTPFFTTCL